MSDDEIRVAIAEKCGWIRHNCQQGHCTNINHAVWSKGDQKGSILDLPDFPNDLNACHEFWQSMSDEDQERFCKELHSVSCPEDCRGLPWHCSYVINATARQRCEAFLRVHGLWKDNPTPERSENRE